MEKCSLSVEDGEGSSSWRRKRQRTSSQPDVVDSDYQQHQEEEEEEEGEGGFYEEEGESEEKDEVENYEEGEEDSEEEAQDQCGSVTVGPRSNSGSQELIDQEVLDCYICYEPLSSPFSQMADKARPGAPTVDAVENAMGSTKPNAEAMGNVSSFPPKISTTSLQKKKDMGSRFESEIWDHFTKLNDNEPKSPKATCNYCGKDYNCDMQKYGSCDMWLHLGNQCKKYPHRVENKRQKALCFVPKTEGDGDSAGVVNLKAVSYSVDECRLALAEMIIVDELPFKHVEGLGFRKFCRVMQPRFTIPSHITVARDCLNLFMKEKEKLKKALKHQRICLTIDTWTSIQNLNYMCLTAHWIDDDWNLQKRILNFGQVPNHKGKTIRNVVEICLLDWGIHDIFTITVNNASFNDSIEYLKRITKNWKSTILENEFLPVRCGVDIVNLIVGESLEDVNESIVKIRNVVRYVRSSPSRLQNFKICMEYKRIHSKNLVCLDLPTRWDSTYLMLEAAEKFQNVFELLDEDDPCFLLYFVGDEDESGKGMTNIGPPMMDDWDNARVLVRFLKLFYNVILRFSSSLHVTSNAFFHEVISMQVKLDQLCKSEDNLLSSMAKRMRMKFEKYWGTLDNINFLLYVAVVLDPRYKLKYVKFCLSQVNDVRVVKEIIKKVKETLIRLYEYYVKRVVAIPSASQDSQESDVEPDEENTHMFLAYQYERFLKEKDSIKSKSEVERYLAESCEHPSNDSFDILGWWKLNSPKYRILSRVARDILAISISTVASESAFSIGGRVLDPFRSSLAPKMVEALVCTQNWLKSSPIAIDLKDAMDAIERYEQHQLV